MKLNENFTVFLSHSKSIKKELVIPFTHQLAELKIPFWFDRNSIVSGDNIYSKIKSEIDNCDICIAFIDDHYLKSS